MIIHFEYWIKILLQSMLIENHIAFNINQHIPMIYKNCEHSFYEILKVFVLLWYFYGIWPLLITFCDYVLWSENENKPICHEERSNEKQIFKTICCIDFHTSFVYYLLIALSLESLKLWESIHSTGCLVKLENTNKPYFMM